MRTAVTGFHYMLKCWKMIAYKKNLILLLSSWNTISKRLMYTNMLLMSQRADRVFWKMIEHCLIMHLRNLFSMYFNSLFVFGEKYLRIHFFFFFVTVIITSCPVLILYEKTFILHCGQFNCIYNCFLYNENLQNIDIEWFHTWFNNPFNIRKNH